MTKFVVNYASEDKPDVEIEADSFYIDGYGDFVFVTDGKPVALIKRADAQILPD